MPEEKLTIDRSMADFRLAYQAKRELLKREKEDFLFALGKQWSDTDRASLEAAGIRPVTDNRIAPNLFLLTGLERQNRTDFKAFPEGEEDGVKADIASALFKDAIKKSGFAHKSSEQFKDGITCGESHLEFYLDYTESLLNGRPSWRKCDGNAVFPEASSREYDFEDARYVYKLTLDLAREDLINLYPEKRKKLEKATEGKLDADSLQASDGAHVQKKDYPKRGGEAPGQAAAGFDLIERYYKKWVKKVFIGDRKTGDVKEAADEATADAFVADYQAGIEQDQAAYGEAIRQAVAATGLDAPFEQVAAELEAGGQLPPPPPEQDPKRFVLIKRMVPEIWCFAHTPGLAEPLADERAWFYPKWKSYPFAPYFARFSTAPLTGEDRHLLVQGVVHGVKNAQEKHNKAETLLARHLNSTANSGWLAEEDTWVEPEKVRQFGTQPGINLEYKKGRQKPERITPSPLSTGHVEQSAQSAEAIKAQLGINSDLLATQQGGADSGRAIALRQKQGLLMVQELFDNLSRSRQIAGRMLLSQLGEIYDTETAMKVLGEAFLRKNFPTPMLLDPANPGQQVPMTDEAGRPMPYDRAMAEVAIAEVLGGELGVYDVSVGEAVASESKLLAQAAEIKELAAAYPGIVPPEMLVRYSSLPEAARSELTKFFEQAQARAATVPTRGSAAKETK